MANWSKGAGFRHQSFLWHWFASRRYQNSYLHPFANLLGVLTPLCPYFICVRAQAVDTLIGAQHIQSISYDVIVKMLQVALERMDGAGTYCMCIIRVTHLWHTLALV